MARDDVWCGSAFAQSAQEESDGVDGSASDDVVDVIVAERRAASAQGSGPAPDEEVVLVEEAAVVPGAAVQDRYSSSNGDVSAPVSVAEKQDTIPLNFNFHGYYRARYNWINNLPYRTSTGTMTKEDASFGTMRLRLDPEITYGPNKKQPIARLRITLDGFDNVVFGDNARVNNVPIFAVDQSATDIYGFDLNDTLKLERAWMEFLVPVGQIRVGRMESNWGLGVLTHDGNGLAEWGDFLRGETFDRVVFATRPLTIFNALTKDDARPTPLIYAFVYDRLSQDPINDPLDPSLPQATFAPFFSTFPERSTAPYAFVAGKAERTNEIVNALMWSDPDYGTAESDELFAGIYIVNRWQDLTNTRLTIPDVAWRLKHTLKNGLQVSTEGEMVTILGRSGALAFTGGENGGACVSSPCAEGKGRIFNVLARAGVAKEGTWAARLEGGFASGDDSILSNNTLKTRAFNTNVKVGMLMYQVALPTLTAYRLGSAQALGANGSVWNSKFLYPQFRYWVLPKILEVHGTFLLGWAHKLDPLVYSVQEDSCGFKKKCFMGWEANVALRTSIGADDIIKIDLEGGLGSPGRSSRRRA
ncbi:MAG: hypothetical protein R3A47_06490 [Polyangiales bacterium]